MSRAAVKAVSALQRHVGRATRCGHRPPFCLRWILAFFLCVVFDSCFSSAQELPPLDLRPVREVHRMIPMRDGVKLSSYMYFPEGNGPWPVLFEQRYADIRGEQTRRAAARLASAGYVVAMVNYRGTYRSEGTWVGYRALGWGDLKDGYDMCEWFGTQPWSTGKVGTFGSSQAGYAQNFLAVTQPPHLTAQYMVDTGLSLFHEGPAYRIWKRVWAALPAGSPSCGKQRSVC